MNRVEVSEWASDNRSVFVPPPHRRVAQRDASAQMWRQAAPKRQLIVPPLSARTRVERSELQPVIPLTSRPALQKRSVPIPPRLHLCEDTRRLPHHASSDHSSDKLSLMSQQQHHAPIPKALLLRQTRHIKAFHTVAMIGQGGYAVVRVVKHKDTGLVCALKQIAKSDFVNEAQLRMAFTEVDILSSRERVMSERRNGYSTFTSKMSDVRIGEMRNPKEKAMAIRKLVERDGGYYFPDFYACWQDDHFIYFLMEYLPGGDLMKHLIDKEIFSEKTAKFYAAQIAIALGYMHDHLHYVHRDVKPDNVLFDGRGHTKLVDFGLSRSLPRTDRHGFFTENFQSAVGTPDYMAPEVHRPAQPHDRSIDWWSLGIILYEMLFGGPPLSDLQHRPEVTSQLIRNWKQFLTSFPKHPSVSNAAKDLLHRLIAERQDRYRTVEEVLAHPWFDSLDLENFRRMKAPIIPQTSGEADVRNFDSFSLSKLIQWEEKKRRCVMSREIAVALNEMRTKRKAPCLIPFACERPSTADGSASSSSCGPSLPKARSITQQGVPSLARKRLASTSDSSSAFPSSSDDTVLVLPSAQPKRLASPRGGLFVQRDRAMNRRPAVPKLTQTNDGVSAVDQSSLLSGIKTAVTRWLTTSSSSSSNGPPPPPPPARPFVVRSQLTATGSQCSPRRIDVPSGTRLT